MPVRTGITTHESFRKRLDVPDDALGTVGVPNASFGT